MATRNPTALSDPPPLEPASISPAHLLYWSVRRELWEHRWMYIVPLIVAGVFLCAFAIGIGFHLPSSAHLKGAPPSGHFQAGPLDFAAFAVMFTYMIVTVVYCLGALHGERSDRSVLFWKSLPVSDAITVIAKASIPILILPLIAFAIIVVTQSIMSLAGSAAAVGGSAGGAAQMPLLPMWAAMLYHLMTVHALYYAPIYGWMLLVSAWARRAAFLWATVPVAAVLIFERLVFNTSAFANMLLSRLGGGPAAIPYPPPGNMPMEAPTLANLAAFLASPGLWLGLAVCAGFLAGAVWLRRRQGPI